MDRRRFLSSTVFSGLGVGGLAIVTASKPAHAFQVDSCSTLSSTQACQELVRHHELLANMDDMLKQKGLDPQQRQAVLAAAICPFCGEPLIG